MLIIIPISKSEKLLINSFCDILKKLGKYLNHDLLVVCSPSAEGLGIELYNKIFDLFKSTNLHVFDAEAPIGWPLGPNYYWSETILYLSRNDNKLPWLWMELDTTPLKFNWANELEKEYYLNNKPFMGVIEKASDNITQYLVGTAIYPPNINLYINKHEDVKKIDLPFDFICRIDIVPNSHETRLIQHRFRTINYIKNNKEEIIGEDIKTKHIGKSYNYPIDIGNGVLHHGCKDTSLARLILNQLS